LSFFESGEAAVHRIAQRFYRKERFGMKAKAVVVFLLVTFLVVPFSPVSIFAQEKAAPQIDVAQAPGSGSASAAAGGTAGAVVPPV
jgi:hypothetical protein